jgi:hypothetical protein
MIFHLGGGEPAPGSSEFKMGEHTNHQSCDRKILSAGAPSHVVAENRRMQGEGSNVDFQTFGIHGQIVALERLPAMARIAASQQLTSLLSSWLIIDDF